jgi:hypothetical protein
MNFKRPLVKLAALAGIFSLSQTFSGCVAEKTCPTYKPTPFPNPEMSNSKQSGHNPEGYHQKKPRGFSAKKTTKIK